MRWSVSEAQSRLSEVQLRAEPRPSAMAELLEFTRKLKEQGDLEPELPARDLEA